MICTAAVAFEATRRLQPQRVATLLEALNSPWSTYALVLTSTFVDALATSLSLTYVSTLLQSIISIFACTSMLCGIFQLLFPPEHSATASMECLLSARQPLTSFYRFTMSILCDTLLDPKRQEVQQIQVTDTEYLQEFNEFLFDS